MDKLKIYRFISFVLSAAPDIAEQFEDLVKDLQERYADQVGTLSADQLDEAFESAPASLLYCAGAFDLSEADPQGTMLSAVGPRGVLRDFFKFVIENPEKVIEWVEIIKDLFGLEAPQE